MASVVALALLASGASANRSSARVARVSVSTRNLLLFSTPSKEAYVNNADDRARGVGHNPFGNYTGAVETEPTNERVFGPFPGDEGIYGFKLFTDANHKNLAGTATAVCQYTLNQASFCDVSIGVEGGQLIAKGASSFASTRFSLPIVGGTGIYRNTTGRVEVTTLGWKTQAQPVHRVAPMVQAQRLAIGPRSKTPVSP